MKIFLFFSFSPFSRQKAVDSDVVAPCHLLLAALARIRRTRAVRISPSSHSLSPSTSLLLSPWNRPETLTLVLFSLHRPPQIAVIPRLVELRRVVHQPHLVALVLRVETALAGRACRRRMRPTPRTPAAAVKQVSITVVASPAPKPCPLLSR